MLSSPVRRALSALLSLGSLALVACPVRADTAPSLAPAMSVDKSSLDNGLAVLLEEDHKAPLVAIALSFHVGSKDDPAGKRGLAHLFEPLLSSPSTRHLSQKVRGEMFQQLKVEPIVPGVRVTLDRTRVSLLVPANELELALWLLSDEMGFFLDGVTPPAFEAARDRVDRELSGSETSERLGSVPRFIHEALYPEGHPYRDGALGDGKGLGSIGRADVLAFARAELVPNNASLTITGSFEKAKAASLVQKYFGPIVRGETPKGPAPAPGGPSAEKRLKVLANVERPRLYLTWSTARFFDPDDIALDAASRLLAGKYGRLRRRLVDGGVATDLAARQQSLELGSEFQIELTLARGHAPDEALAIVDEELGKLRAQPAPADELGRVVQPLIAQTAFSQDALQGRAEQMSLFYHHNGRADYLGAYLASYQALSPEAVQKAVTAQLSPSRRVVTMVQPAEGAPVAGRLAEGP